MIKSPLKLQLHGNAQIGNKRSLKEVVLQVATLKNEQSVNLHVEVTGSQRPAKHPQVPLFNVAV